MKMIDSMRSLSISFHSKKDHSSDQWVDTLTAKAEMNDTSSEEVDVNMSQNIEERNGALIITLKVICNGSLSSIRSINANGRNKEILKKSEKLQYNIRKEDEVRLVEERTPAIAPERYVVKEVESHAHIDKDIENGVEIAVQTTKQPRKLLFDTETQTDGEMLNTVVQSIDVQTEKTIQPDIISVDMAMQTDIRAPLVPIKAMQTDIRAPLVPIKELKFGPICSKNVRIENEGNSVKNLKHHNNCYYTSAFTNRTLENGEIFQIRLDEEWKKMCGLCIGVTNKFNDTEMVRCMINSEGTWGYFNKKIYVNGEITNSKCGEGTFPDKVGKTLGLMRNVLGDLYFFVNGKNQGLAAKGVPPIIYGFVELLYGATRVSIVNS